ncbi:hypothetical protein LINGRAHAP2_LOCUS33490 [Linum grandiflorum]
MLSKTLFTSFSQLKTLSLCSFRFTFSVVSFDGFDRLTVLQLRNIMFNCTTPELSFRCPLLTTLILERCYGCLSRFVVEDAQLLECLCLVDFRCESALLGEAVGTVETLSIGIGNSYEYITPKEPWVKLRRLTLVGVEERCSKTRSNVLAVVRMIMNSPSLQRLEIQMKDAYVDDSDYEDSDEDDDEDSDEEAVDITELTDVASEYEQLRLLTKVEVRRFRGTKNEMTLISWLLSSIPALDEMKIKMSAALSQDELLRVVIQLNKLQRDSSKAQIVIN